MDGPSKRRGRREGAGAWKTAHTQFETGNEIRARMDPARGDLIARHCKRTGDRSH